jgi:hypothetical protein
MKLMPFAPLLILVFFVAAAHAYFPLDVMDEQATQVRELMKEVRAILNVQQAIMRGLPCEGRAELMRENARLIHRMDEMAARAAMPEAPASPPYATSYVVASHLRSVMQRPY